jgi:hypothetical protein
MRLITNMELNEYNEGELRMLFGLVSKALAQTERESAARRNGLASLENINRALVVRHAAIRP